MDSLSDDDLQVLAIYRNDGWLTLDPQTIKNEDVSEEEYAAVSQTRFTYVNTAMDWIENIYGDIAWYLGDVSTSKKVYLRINR